MDVDGTTMDGVSQGFLSPAAFAAANTFDAPGRSISKNKNENFLKPFGNTATNNSDPAVNIQTDAAFFDFDPHSSSNSPFGNQFSTPAATGLPGWGSDMAFHPMSPPPSVLYSPKDWPYSFQPMLTELESDTRAKYGQVTPPDDEDDNATVFHQEPEPEPDQSPSKPRKRKRTESSAKDTFSKDPSAQPTKRIRKHTSHRSNASTNADECKPEDARRSKFLERNRVAASKCRQKKKEWTQDLENRARELQKNNNSLRILVGSLREEVAFLQGEMVKRGIRDCVHVEGFLKAGSISPHKPISEHGSLKREMSPIEDGVATSPNSAGDGAKQSGSPRGGSGTSSMERDETSLEALLTSSINHDTSAEGIASLVGAG